MESAYGSLSVNDVAPDFSLPSIDGTHVISLSELCDKGSNVLLVFLRHLG